MNKISPAAAQTTIHQDATGENNTNKAFKSCGVKIQPLERKHNTNQNKMQSN